MLHQRFEIERLRAVRVGRAIGAAAHHDLHSLGGGRQLHGVLEDGNHAVFAAGVLGVVVVHVGLDVARKVGS